MTHEVPTHEPSGGLRIRVGDGWRAQAWPEGLRLTRRPGTGRGAVVVSAASEPAGGRTLDGYVRRQLAALEALATDLRVLDRGQARLDARPARRVLASHRQGRLRLVTDAVWCVTDGRAHTLAASGLPGAFRFLEAWFDAVVDSAGLDGGGPHRAEAPPAP